MAGELLLAGEGCKGSRDDARRRRGVGLLVCLGCTAALLLSASALIAEAPPLPSSRYGDLEIGGQPANPGTVVAAYFAGQEIGRDYSFADGTSSRFRLDVPGDRAETPEVEGPTSGQSFEIRVGGVAVATSIWTQGSFEALNLAAEAGTDLSVEVDDSEVSVQAGQLLVSAVVVTNSGPGTAPGVLTSVTLPADVLFVSASDGGVLVGSLVSWPAFLLTEGGVAVRSVSYRLPASFPPGVEEIAILAAVENDGTTGADPNPENDRAIDTDLLQAQPDLVISIDDGTANALPGQTLFYRVLVTNSGSQGATGAELSIELPAELDYYSSSHGGGFSGNAVSFPAVPLAAGQSFARSLTMRVPADSDPAIGSVSVVAAVADDLTNGTDPNPADNVATDIDAVEHRPDLAVVILDRSALSIDAQSLLVSGAALVRFANLGTVSAASHVVAIFADLNRDGRFSRTFDRVLGEVVQVVVLAGEVVDLEIPVAGVAEFRDDRIFVALDADQSLEELDESNNVADSGSACESPGDLGEMDPIVELSWPPPGGPTYKPLSVDSVSTPLVLPLTDDNGDGLWNELDVPSIIFVSANLAPTFPPEPDIVLRAIRGDTGAPLWNVLGLFTVPPSFISLSGLAGGDIDLDGRPEIVASVVSPDGYGFLQAYEHNGAFKWRSQNFDTHPFGSGTSNRDSPALADLDGDGDVEIVVGAHVFDHTGHLLWHGAGGQAYQTQRNNQLVGGAISVVADVDLDGFQEIVTGNTLYRWNGEVLWQRAEPDGYPAVLNADADPQAEIVVVSRGFVRLHDTDGSILWGPIEMPGTDPESGGPPAIGDLDGDGVPEIVIAGADVLWVLGLDGSPLWQASTRDYSSSQTGAALFDFDGDGAHEIVYRDERRLRLYRGSDGVVLYELILSSTTMTEMPVVADVDRDGHAEIVVTSDHAWDYAVPAGQRTGGLRVVGDAQGSWRVARSIWNQHSYAIGNVASSGAIPPRPDWSWLSHNSFRANSEPAGSPLARPDITAGRLLVDMSALPVVTANVRVGNAGATVVAPGIAVTIHDGGDPATGIELARATVPVALPPGTFVDLSMTFDTGAGVSGTLSALADADRREAECDESNNIHSTSVDTTSLGLWLTKSDGEISVAPGEQLTYTLVVHNSFAGEASGVALSDSLPAGVLFGGASDGGVESGGIVTWPPFSLVSEGVAVRTVTAIVDPDLPLAVSSLANVASVSDDGMQGPDPTPGNNVAIDFDLVQTVIADAGGPYVAGEGEELVLDGSASHDRDGGELLFAWDLDGDDVFDDASTATATYSFADEGAFIVRLRVTDDEGEVDIEEAQVTVDNLPPTVVPPIEVAGEEGGVLGLVGFVVSDPGVEDVLEAMVDWGDGAPTESVAIDGGEPQGQHVYVEDGIFVVELCASDGDGGSQCASAPAVIVNREPEVRAIDAFDFIDWEREELGAGTTTRWSETADHLAVTEEWNGEPSFLVGDLPGYGTIELVVRVSDNGDDDYFGVAVGFEAGDTTSATANYLLLDWKREDQTGARRGLALSRVSGTALVGELWLHQDQAANGTANRVDELMRATTLGSTGWARHTDYRWRIESTPTRLRLYVDGRLELDYAGPVPFGRLALYDYSQSKVTFTADLSDSFVVAREGEVANLRVAFVDAGIEDTHSATVDWGDGSSDVGNVAEEDGRGEVFGDHVYFDDGDYEIATCVSDDDGGTGCGTTPAVIENVAPLPSLTVDSPGFFEEPVTISGSVFADPGVLDTHTVFVQWGDGESDLPVPAGGGGTWTFGGSHLYGAPGTYQIEACVTDDDGGTGCDTRALSLVARTLDLEVAKSVVPVEARPGQNVVFSLRVRNIGTLPATGVALTDQLPPHLAFVSATLGGANNSGTVSWDLGTLAPGAAVTPTLTLQVSATAPYGATVTNLAVVADDGLSGGDSNPANNSSSAALTFSDALTPIVSIAAPWAGFEGTLLALSGVTWNDTTAAQAHTGTISWGDGQTTTATLIPANGTSGAVNGSHVYAEDGIYSVEICVRDATNLVGCRSSTATIANRPPEVITPGSVTLRSWIEEEYAGSPSANWVIAADGLSVLQTVNSRPSVFFSPLPAIGTFLEGTIRVESAGGWDDDYIGFVLGFEAGDTVDSAADYLLVDWKQRNQSGARQGLAVSRVHGVAVENEFWSHYDDPSNGTGNGLSEIARGLTLGNTGWADNREYRFRFETAADRLRVWVDDILQFDLAIPVPDGRFGFYNYSQEAVRYRGFSTGLQQRFEGELFDLDAPFVDPGSLDTHEGTIDWDDGAQTEANVTSENGFGFASQSHAFPDDGDFSLEVCVVDDEGDSDCGLFPLLVLNRPPFVEAAADTVAYPGVAQAIDLGSFTDPGVLDSHVATVDWGDAEIGDGVIDEDGGAGVVSAFHAYAAPGSYAISFCVTDDDGATGCDGLTVTVLDAAPPLLRVEKAATVLDRDGDGLPSPGDDIRYRIEIFNDGEAMATGLVLVDPIPAHSALVAGSIYPELGVVDSDPVTIVLDPMEGGTSLLAQFAVRISDPLPDGVDEIVNVGWLSSDGLPSVPTDDPGLPGPADPTRTPVFASPAIRVEKSDLLVDIDNDGVASPGDQLEWTIAVTVSGDTAAVGLLVRDPIGAHLELVGGSLEAPLGRILSSSPVAVLFDTVAVGETVTVTFRTTIDPELPPAIEFVSNQASVLASSIDAVPSDDPATPELFDPTEVPVYSYPALSISGLSVSEGSAGLLPISFALALDRPARLPVTVDWVAEGISAAAGEDFVAASGSIVIPVDESGGQIVVDVIGDLVVETNEAFQVVLSNPVFASVEVGAAVATLLNDDSTELSIADSTVNEGEAATVTLSLSMPSALPVTVEWMTEAGSAIPGEDFVAAGGSAFFAPFEMFASVGIDTVDDDEEEAAEAFRIDLFAPTVATILDGTGEVSILDDDAPECTLICPEGIAVASDPLVCGAQVEIVEPTGGGSCGEVSCSPDSGFFPVGTTTVTCSSSTTAVFCSFDITILDTEPPAVFAPELSAGNDPGRCDAEIGFDASATDNCPGELPVICTPAAGSIFAVGTTSVACRASDAAGNEGQALGEITVLDVEAPVLASCPESFEIVVRPGGAPIAVEFEVPNATDNCPGVSVTCEPASGDLFPAGESPVVCTAADAVPLSTTCDFVISVFEPSVLEIPALSRGALVLLAALFAGLGLAMLRARRREDSPDRR